MKFLNPDIPLDGIRLFGFDMDGTLYDEFDYVLQAYTRIAELLAAADKDAALRFMVDRWLEKGSSYPFIYGETLERFGDTVQQDMKIKEALAIYRTLIPEISLAPRIRYLLDRIKRDFPMFLVSDGSSILQWNKVRALGLEEFFDRENIFISGDHGKGFEKPNILGLERIPLISDVPPDTVLFVGDRERDAQFARNAGFRFVHIKDLFAAQ